MKVRDKCEKKFRYRKQYLFYLGVVNDIFSITLSRTIYNFEYSLELQNGCFFFIYRYEFRNYYEVIYIQTTCFFSKLDLKEIFFSFLSLVLRSSESIFLEGLEKVLIGTQIFYSLIGHYVKVTHAHFNPNYCIIIYHKFKYFS